MKITLQQIQEDIKSGKSKFIYYSTQSCWWTHLNSDIKKSTKIGKMTRAAIHQGIMANDKIPQDKRDEMQTLFKMASKNPNMPLDPTGSTLYYMDDPAKWMESALSKPDHYGKHKVDALIMSHHQNCQGVYGEWIDYNNLIDELNK